MPELFLSDLDPPFARFQPKPSPAYLGVSSPSLHRVISLTQLILPLSIFFPQRLFDNQPAFLQRLKALRCCARGLIRLILPEKLVVFGHGVAEGLVEADQY